MSDCTNNTTRPGWIIECRPDARYSWRRGAYVYETQAEAEEMTARCNANNPPVQYRVARFDPAA